MKFVSGVAAAVLFTAAVPQLWATAIPQQPLIDSLRRQDRHASLRLAREMFKTSADDPQTQFWTIFAAPNTAEGRKARTLLHDADAQNPWSLLAKSLNNPLTSDTFVNQAIAKAPSDSGLLQACVLTLIALAGDAVDLQPMAAFLDAHRSAFDSSADLLVTEAAGYNFLTGTAAAPHAKQDMLAELDKALELDPHNEPAVLMKARQGASLGSASVYAFLQKEAPLFPDSYPVQTALWTAGFAQPDVKATEPAVRSSMVAMIRHKEPTILELRSCYQATSSSPETTRAFEDALLATYPHSAAADQVALTRADQDLAQGTPDQNTTARIVGLEAFLTQHPHADPEVVDYANVRLEQLLASQPEPDLAKLYAAVEKAPDSSRGLRLLARKKYRLPDLERIALANFALAWRNVGEFFPTSRDVTSFVDFMLGDYVHFYSTSLGLVYLEEGKLDQAQTILDRAVEIRRTDSETLTVLGQVHQAKGEYATAQSLMLEALNQGHFGLPKNPALAALPELYKAEHHGTAGLDDFMKPLLAKAREDNKRAIVAGRERQPKPLPAFKFTDLAGKTVSSDDYKGKIVVINFWATWCGPCRAEFPQFQKLYEKYKDDARVAILAVATDEMETPNSTVTTYLDKNKFTFPVARSWDYPTANHINIIPLTWWVDPDGKVVYKKLGSSEELVDEYTWRIDAIEGASTPKQAVAPSR